MSGDSENWVPVWYREDLTDSPGLVWLKEERTFGLIAGPINAFHTLIRFTYQGVYYEVEVENDEFEILNPLEKDEDDSM